MLDAHNTSQQNIIASQNAYIISAYIKRIYSNHYRWLVSSLHKKLSCHQTAADLAQDTFLRLLKKETTIEIAEPRAYLTTIAHGLMVSYLRRKAVEAAYLATLADMAVDEPSVEMQLIIIETIVQIDNMLAELPTKVRAAYLLLQLEGLSYAEIAKQLNVTTRSVTNYIAKASLHCAIFKQNLQKYD